MRAATARTNEGARLLVMRVGGATESLPRAQLAHLFRAGDVLVANDAATIPASLQGTHLRSGRAVEVRLAARPSLHAEDIHRFEAIVFGEGSHHIRTEDRASPPTLHEGDAITFGDALHAHVVKCFAHPRHVVLDFEATPDAFWSALAAQGRPIQYAHIEKILNLWDVWTLFAGPPVAFEAPSAAFALDWQMIEALRARGVQVVTLTHAAGISSTGDAALDALLPLDEPYRIPTETAQAIGRAHAEGGRVIALGTSVARALEDAADRCGLVRAGSGVARSKLGVHSTLRVVDGLLSGTHEPGTSHFELLRAFASDDALEEAAARLDEEGFRTHEFGDSVLLFSMRRITAVADLSLDRRCQLSP
jgi:S-adenosylmethionine:tRNA ribosyltransferase-isomerase